MGPKFFFPGDAAPGPPRGLSMSAPTWAYRRKPSLHGLSLSKSPIKNHAILFGSGRQTESNKTRLHKARHMPPKIKNNPI